MLLIIRSIISMLSLKKLVFRPCALFCSIKLLLIWLFLFLLIVICLGMDWIHMWDLRFSRRWRWWWCFSGFWLIVDWSVVANESTRRQNSGFIWFRMGCSAGCSVGFHKGRWISWSAKRLLAFQGLFSMESLNPLFLSNSEQPVITSFNCMRMAVEGNRKQWNDSNTASKIGTIYRTSDIKGTVLG
jgi:hypothetical protein